MDNEEVLLDEERIDRAFREIQHILQKYDLAIDFDISFDQYGTRKENLPQELQLALMILKNNGMKISFVLMNKPEILPPDPS